MRDDCDGASRGDTCPYNAVHLLSSGSNTCVVHCSLGSRQLFIFLLRPWQKGRRRGKTHPLCKVLHFHSHMKEKCLELYQPFVHLSIDECMVRSKARSHFCQYILKKAQQVGVQILGASRSIRYTVDFDM